MVASTIAADVAAVDDFLAAQKTLSGAPPEFGISAFNRSGQYEREAIWPIADYAGIVTTRSLQLI